ncbi:MAG TPA: hypothetical protein VGQ99_19595 [Tepidisphaeraceae bacterium]|jgi:hypothetical protein|nr:hypothetical protein [Tepidisphaeraceae bacterium]
MKKVLVLTWMMLLAWATACRAEEHGAAAAPTHGAEHAVDTAPHPGVPEHPAWARPVAMLIAVMFLLAIPIGVFIRATMPEEVPPAHAHDEHHGHKDPHGDPGLGGHDAHGHAPHH